jgi:hypothetical protein
MTRSTLSILYAGFLLISILLRAQPESPLQLALTRFEVKNISIPDAVVKAGQQAGVPIGLDASDPELWKKKISLQTANATLGEVLRQILAAGPAYTIRQDGRAVVIRCAPRQSDLLDTRIIDFKMDRLASANQLSSKLWMTLVTQVSPSRMSFLGGGLGSLYSSLEKAVLPPVDLSGKTVWEILDWIVGTHGSAAWVAVPFHGEVGKSIGPSDLWRLDAYSAPATNH